MKKALLLCLLLLALKCGAQTTLYVDSSITASGAGTSWTTAYKTLNEALNVANGASTTFQYVINIAKGRYYPTGAQSATNRDSTFLIIRDKIKLYGGYPSGGGNRDINANATILDGNIGSATNSTDNSYHVMTISNVVSTDSITLDGLTFTNGRATGTNTSGGGLYITSISVQLYSNNCIFLNNNAANGGGIYMSTTSNNTKTIYFTKCSFQENTATDGAGIYDAVNDGACTIDSCSFLNNTASGNGGGMHNETSGVPAVNILISNCTYSGNKAQNGGGSYNYDFLNNGSTGLGKHTISMSGCTFTGDTATNGGGIYSELITEFNNTTINATSAASIAKCTFSGNSATQGGGGVFVDQKSSLGVPISNGISARSLSQCTFTTNTANNGGAIYINNNIDSVITISQCSISGNNAINGAGIYSLGFIIIDTCTISNNIATNAAGGIHGGGATTLALHTSQIQRSIISGNIGGSDGGGIYMTTKYSIQRTKIIGNTADTGAGIYIIQSSPSLQECLFSGNLANGNGGAFYNYNGSPVITNCTLVNDSALNGAALFNTTTSSPVVTNTIMWEGPNSVYNIINSNPVITYSITQDAAPYTGVGNSVADPSFVSPTPVSAAPDTTGNYSLLACSPAINAGHPGFSNDAKDLPGNTRIFNGTIDIGAYEFQSTYPVPITGSNTVCLNATTQLSNIFAGGMWTSSNPAIATVDATTGVVTGVAAGADTITYVAAVGGCTSTTTLKITVNAPPAVATINGDSAVCMNSAITLTATTTNGGVWASTNTALATVNTSGKITGMAPGVDTITYKVTGGGCSSVAMKAITIGNVYPTVAAITGDTAVCQGGTITLSDATAGGKWTSQNTGLATVDASSGVVTGENIFLSYDTIFYTVVNNVGCSASAKKALYIASAPNVDAISIGGTALCFNEAGDYTNATDATPGGTWASSNTAVATIDNTGKISAGGSQGITTVSYTLTNAAGCAASAIVDLAFNKAYNTSFTETICQGSQYTFDGQTFSQPGSYQATFSTTNGCDSLVTLVLSVTTINTAITQSGNTLTASQAAAAYQWYTCAGNIPISGATGQSFTPTTSGQYSVLIKLNGCNAYSACKNITLGVNDINGTNDVQLFPNPTTGQLTVNTGNTKATYILVKDITGRTMQQLTPTDKISNLDLSGYTPGMYLVEILYEGGEKYTNRVNVIH